ncbi:MAG: BMP family ABC transporter substrate-binding protein [Clostridia bacterium]|nr:BMP family ABC transporter substrate-binding protein [Clostridia bacterium]
MKKFLSLLLVAALALTLTFSFVACSNETANGDEAGENNAEATNDIKVGFIFLHDENSTYDKNFIDAAVAVQNKLGLTNDQVIMVTGIPEGSECYDAAIDLIDQGCTLIFADSFGHEPFLLDAARENPDVQFCHATGTMAHTAGLANFHNAFASIYEGRFLAGIAAGMKLNEMIANGDFTAEEALIGYVGAHPYAEVKSGYTSFFLGARSVCPTATMEVQFTGSWYDEALEREAANVLIGRGAKLVSQHADSMGAPSACEEAGIPNVSYNGTTIEACPNTYIISSRIDWAPYFELMITAVQNGTEIPTDWCGGIKEGSVKLTDLNTAVAAAGTQEAIDAAKAQFEEGTLKVFATDTFTVGGVALDEETLADVDTDDTWTAETKVVSEGYYHESEFRSAPYFDINIDGITLLN